MAKKKVVVGKEAEEKPVEEKLGEEVKSEPAFVDEPMVKVRGAKWGGAKEMTLSEYKKCLKDQKKS